MSSEISIVIAAVVSGLRAAAHAHADGRVHEIGDGWDDVAALEHDDPRVSIALNFWEAWADSAAHDWRYYGELSAKDWPLLADHIIAALNSDGPISDPVLIEHFGVQPARPSVADRLASFVRRLAGVTR